MSKLAKLKKELKRLEDKKIVDKLKKEIAKLKKPKPKKSGWMM